jgi:hypothetical protein
MEKDGNIWAKIRNYGNIPILNGSFNR